MKERTVYFVVPEYELPSWGIGMIYHMTHLSDQLGVSAKVMRMGPNLKIPKWLKIDVTQCIRDEVLSEVRDTDLLIVPELVVAQPWVSDIGAEKIVLIQGGFLINQGLNGAKNYQDLGFSSAVIVMPHLDEIVQQFWPIETSLIPPFVADYFYLPDQELNRLKRKKQVLLFPKPGYREIGYYDYEIIKSMLDFKIAELNEGENDIKLNWKVIELVNFSHKEVGNLMKESLFFVNTNCFECLNSTVIEAMAAGCIPFCYEAFGGKDYLRHEDNAYVFQNNYVYPLISTLFAKMENLESEKEQNAVIRQNGWKTAKNYTSKATLIKLSQFYSSLNLV